MFLTPEIITIFILNIILVLFASIAFFMSVKIYLNWDLSSTSNNQYILEKQSYLSATIIKFIFIVKIPLFIFFIFTIDKLSTILPGAMCGAGVVNATQYGVYLLILKILNIYLFAYWLVLNYRDTKQEEMPFVKLKFFIYIIGFFLFISEIILEFLMFDAIDVKKVVDCCGAIYSSSSGSYLSILFTLSDITVVSLFYINFLFLIIFYFLKNRYLFALTNVIFVIVSLITLIVYFGTYIYELPTHHCPFCFLQQDYNYIGYLLYILLYSGTFYGLIIGLVRFSEKELVHYFNISMILNTLYMVIISYYPISYYFKNGVWL